jgi:hypothetical protein
MKKGLQLLGALAAVATITLWLATGANRGWTKTSEQVKTLDEFGLDKIEWRKKFSPGVDAVAIGLLGAGVLAGVSFLFRNRNQNKTE